MKIVFFLTQDLSSPSGLGRYFPLAKELVKLGNEVKIIALHSNYKSIKETELIIDGVSVKYIGQMQVLKVNNEKIYFPARKLLFIMMVALIKFIFFALFLNFDVLVVGKPHPMNGIAGVVAKYVRNKKIIIDCDDFEAQSNRFQNKVQYALIKFFEDRIPLIGDVVTTHTEFNKQRLLNLGLSSDKVKIIPNGVDRERFAQVDLKEVENLRQELNLTGKRVIGFIGSISLKSHPINLLLEACKLIIPRYPDLMIMCVGGGEDIGVVKGIANELDISKHLLMIGRINPDEIVLYYKLCYLTVDPVYDNATAKGRLPLKMFESWACDIPFVTSDVGDRKFYLSDPECGMLAMSDSPIELANKIEYILVNKDTKDRIIKNSRNRRKLFYWDVIVYDFLDGIKHEK
ncbi:MAG: hypothetical protein CL609_09300 [Anaerolineaceae bacterium]|nr:hypothetical protein [Anaerolineaceae bacterium]